MHPSRLVRFLPVALVALAACGDNDPNAVPAPRPPAPLSAISDGTRAGGNPNFFFLPPLLPNPSGDSDYSPGQFSAKWKPEVRICRLTSAAVCETTPAGAPVYLRTFKGSEVVLSTVDEHYAVHWNTREAWATAATYRAEVILPRRDTVVLGFVDVALLPDGQSFRNAQLVETVPLQDGRTVPLKFRIENGAAVSNTNDYVEATVTDAGGTFTTNTGFAGIAIEPGWLPDGIDEVVLTIERVPLPGSVNDCHDLAVALPWLRQYEGCYQIETFPNVGIIQADAVVGVCSEAPTVEGQVMYKSDPLPGGGRRVKALENAALPTSLAAVLNASCPGFSGIASLGTPGFRDRLRDGAAWVASGIGRAISPKPLYALDLGAGGQLRALTDDLSLFNWAVPVRIDVVSGNNQTATAGAALPAPLVVRVTDGHVHGITPAGQPRSGVPVQFTVPAGNGTITWVGITDANGLVTANWTLGAPGVNTVTASIPDDSSNNPIAVPQVRAATFTATANAATVVEILLNGIDVTDSTVAMTVGGTADLNELMTPPPIEATCTWTSSNPAVATVSGTGLVTAVASGTATITVTCNGVPASTTVSVSAPLVTIDSIRVQYAGNQFVPLSNDAIITWFPTNAVATTFTAIPYDGNTAVTSVLCTYGITNPTAAPALMTISTQGPAASTDVLPSGSSPVSGQQAIPSTLGITCGEATRNVNVFAFPPIG